MGQRDASLGLPPPGGEKGGYHHSRRRELPNDFEKEGLNRAQNSISFISIGTNQVNHIVDEHERKITLLVASLASFLVPCT